MITSLRPPPCARCGSRVISVIAFDPAAALEQRDEGRPALLRDVDPTGNRPKWRCAACGYKWGYANGMSGSSPPGDLA